MIRRPRRPHRGRRCLANRTHAVPCPRVPRKAAGEQARPGPRPAPAEVRGTTAIRLEDPEAGSASHRNRAARPPLVHSPLVTGAQPALRPTAPMATTRPSLEKPRRRRQGFAAVYIKAFLPPGDFRLRADIYLVSAARDRVTPGPIRTGVRAAYFAAVQDRPSRQQGLRPGGPLKPQVSRDSAPAGRVARAAHCGKPTPLHPM